MTQNETVSLGPHTVWTHVPCPNCEHVGLKPGGEFATRQCPDCGEVFEEETQEIEVSRR